VVVLDVLPGTLPCPFGVIGAGVNGPKGLPLETEWMTRLPVSQIRSPHSAKSLLYMCHNSESFSSSCHGNTLEGPEEGSTS
jgi:hypothetical protein